MLAAPLAGSPKFHDHDTGLPAVVVLLKTVVNGAHPVDGAAVKEAAGHEMVRKSGVL